MAFKIRGGVIVPLNHSPATTREEVIQNVSILLATRAGTCPLYRDFGLSQDIVDKPMVMREPLLIQEIHEKVERYEPRAKITKVTFELDVKTPGKLIPIVEVELPDG